MRVQAEALDLEVSVQERAASDAQLNDVKALLGRMMFTGRSVHKKVHPGFGALGLHATSWSSSGGLSPWRPTHSA